MKSFNEISFKDEKALIRVDFNVPLDKQTFAITDDNRIRAAIPTIQKILQDGGSVILMSHLGRPKEGPENKYSLVHLVKHLEQLLSRPVQFASDCIGQDALDLSANLKPGEVLLLENLRFYKEEEKGDKAFAEKLSKLGTFWVNDAFGTAHRAHASTAVIAEFFPAEKRSFGFLMEGEVKAAEQVLHQATPPFTAIIGGAKVSDKILIIENLLNRATDIIIGGGMAYTFKKALGGQIGGSLCEEDRLELAKSILDQAAQKGVQIHLPEDSIIADKFAADANTQTADSDAIPAGWMGLDIGPKAQAKFAEVIQRSKTVLWKNSSLEWTNGGV
ncbi:MAG: phosphoglycerate kinase [Sediminibacterium sp.]|nr:phosphoglycerate kinase [Sediminibacterium sp.]